MSRIEHLAEGVTLYLGDCREFIKSLPDNSIDSVPCDPPYALTSASRNGSPRNNDPETPFGRTKLGERGFMGKTWDTGEVVEDVTFWREVFRVLKPGGHLAAFSASRTYHRMACAIEDAGFEIRDSLMWLYGTGFPKSLDVSKAIDASFGAERQVIGERARPDGSTRRRDIGGMEGSALQGSADGSLNTNGAMAMLTAPVTSAAIEFDGFGTALKPAFEPIVLARKPLSEPTVAANVLKWRTGALNIDGCRVGAEGGRRSEGNDQRTESQANAIGAYKTSPLVPGLGRWPANVVTDGSDEVVGMFPSAPGQLAPISTAPGLKTGNVYGKMNREGEASADRRYTDQGGTNFAMRPGQRREPAPSAARFFYSAKASKQDRNGSKHPTVKPIALMQWLARLITPPQGTILDPFAGSGTTGAAAMLEGFKCILMEREAEYQQDIIRRIQAAKEEQEEKQEQPTLVSVAPAPPPKQEVML